MTLLGKRFFFNVLNLKSSKPNTNNIQECTRRNFVEIETETETESDHRKHFVCCTILQGSLGTSSSVCPPQLSGYLLPLLLLFLYLINWNYFVKAVVFQVARQDEPWHKSKVINRAQQLIVYLERIFSFFLNFFPSLVEVRGKFVVGLLQQFSHFSSLTETNYR